VPKAKPVTPQFEVAATVIAVGAIIVGLIVSTTVTNCVTDVAVSYTHLRAHETG
jgi:hypothetical protein